MTQPDYWQRQTAGKLLFPDLAWSRPEHKAQAGKLLIVGGNQFGFVAPAEAFKAAGQAGIGTARMVLPDSLKRYVGQHFETGQLAPSTPSGSFSQKALAVALDEANWADAVLLAGDFGRNSETAILLEKFAGHYSGQLTICQDAADYFISLPELTLQRPDTLMALSFSQAQKLFITSHFPHALTSDMSFFQFIERLHDFSSQHQLGLLVEHDGTWFVAKDGRISSTARAEDDSASAVQRAAAAAVWWLQQPNKTFEALTTSLV